PVHSSLKHSSHRSIHPMGRSPPALCPGGDMPSDDEARNLAPRNGGFWSYLWIWTALGLALPATALPQLTGAALPLMGAAFYGAAVLLVLLELRPLVTAGSPDAN